MTDTAPSDQDGEKRLLASVPWEVGMIMPFFGLIPPANWLICNGDPVPSRYPDLKNMMPGPHHETPNLSGRTLIGTGILNDPTIPKYQDKDGKSRIGQETYNLGDIGGEAYHALDEKELAPHAHKPPKNEPEHLPSNVFMLGYDAAVPSEGEYGFDKNGLYKSMNKTDSTASAGGDGSSTTCGKAHNNIQPYYAVTYIIYAGMKINSTLE